MNWYKKAVNIIDPSDIEYTNIGHASYINNSIGEKDWNKIKHINYSWIWNGENIDVKHSKNLMHEDIWAENKNMYYKGRIEQIPGQDKILVSIYPNRFQYPGIQFKEIPEELINQLVNFLGSNIEIHVVRN